MIQESFIEARCIHSGGRTVMMPLVEMVNHGEGSHYESSAGIAVRGTFPGEVFVQYSASDTYNLFHSFGFVVASPIALSIPLKGTFPSGQVVISREFNGIPRTERDLIPRLEKRSGRAELTFLMLGHERFPRLARGIFYKLMRDAGYQRFEETFDYADHLNRMHFLNIIASVEDLDVPMAKMLRRMAVNQLRALSFAFGVREI
jgi:hypothetical protein